MNSIDSRVFIVLVFFSCLGQGAEPARDIGEDLSNAHKAWEEAQALGARAILAPLNSKQQNEDVEKLLEQQEAAYKATEDAFGKALEKDPQHPLALSEYARYWLSRKQFTRARANFDAALSSPKAKDAFTAVQTADILRTLGGLCERGGETNRALDHYHQALELNPTDVRNRISLAVALCADGRPEEAAKLLKPWDVEGAAGEGVKAGGDGGAPIKNPAMYALGLYTLALALEESGFPEDALRIYRKALHHAELAEAAESGGVAERAEMATARLEDLFDAWQDREKDRARENESRVKNHLKPQPAEREEFANASRSCEQGMHWKTFALEDKSFLAAVRRGEAEKHPALETFTAAMNAFTEAIREYPKCARAHYELGLCNVMLGHFGMARTLLDAASLYSPNDIAILNLQGEVLLELGQWEDAAKAFKKVLSIEPECGRANFGLGRAYAALKSDALQCQAALDALDRALQLGVRDPRMFPSKVLTLSDGQELEGRVREEGDVYLVQIGVTPAARIAKADVKEVREKPGLRDEMLAMLDRFERGEKPVERPIFRGAPAKRGHHNSNMPDAWNGPGF